MPGKRTRMKFSSTFSQNFEISYSLDKVLLCTAILSFWFHTNVKKDINSNVHALFPILFLVHCAVVNTKITKQYMNNPVSCYLCMKAVFCSFCLCLSFPQTNCYRLRPSHQHSKTYILQNLHHP